MLIDVHVHVGQFKNHNYSPTSIFRLMKRTGVDYFAVSSTTQCEENYQKVLDELHQLIDMAGEKVIPVMWITPEGLKGNIAWYLESDIKWRCLKIHPFLHKDVWVPNEELFNEVIDIARELDVPILIHTGDESCCQSHLYEPAISKNPDISFILAHGRPLEDALSLVKTYNNAYADSAFMPVECMKQFVDNGLSRKLLWGTDMCIPKHFYPHKEMFDYYKGKVDAFRAICTTDQFEMVTYQNAKQLFKIY